MEQLTKMAFPEGYVCQHRENIMQLANMIGRKKPGVKPGEKGGYSWDDPEYVILEAGVDDDMCQAGLAARLLRKEDRRGSRRHRRQT